MRKGDELYIFDYDNYYEANKVVLIPVQLINSFVLVRQKGGCDKKAMVCDNL